MSTLQTSQDIQDLWDKQVFELEDQEIQIIQEDRSDYRKNRYQKLPILISILNEINNSSNLADLANRYDKYKLKKKSELQIEKEFNEIMNSVYFSQNKNKINLYQKSQISDEKVQIQVSQEIIHDQKTKIEDIIEMLEKTQSNIQADLNKIKEENKNLENKINSYFDSLQTEDSNSCRQLNVLNYNLSQRQSYYQDIQISTLPILVSEKQEWEIKVQIQENKISQLEQELQNLCPLEQMYKNQENYISQLKYAQQLLKNEINNLKDKTEQLKQAQQIMQLELKFESFCQKLLEYQQKGKTQALIDFQELLKNEKLRMVQKYKKDCNQSFVCQQEMFDFDYDEMEEIADELSQNKSQVERNRKVQILKKQTQDMMSKIKLEQQKLKNENNQLSDELNNEKKQQLTLKLQDLQQQKDSYSEIYQLRESDIQKLEEEIKIAKLMSEDIEKNNSKQSILEENGSSSALGWFRRLLSTDYYINKNYQNFQNLIYQIIMSKYNKKNFLQQKKEEKLNRELTKKKIDVASKIYLFYKNGKICQQLLQSLIAANQQKIRTVLTSKSTLEQNVYNKVCNQLLNKYPEILKPFQLLNKKNAQNYEEYIIGILEIFAASLQLKQSSFILKTFSNFENLIYRLHFLKAILLVFVLLKNSPNQMSLLTITNEILLKVDMYLNNNDKKTFFKYFKILNTNIVEECMNQILKYQGFQIFLHSYLEKQNNDGANNLAFQFLLITNELKKEFSKLMQMVLQSSQFNQLLQNQLISDQDLEKINILFQKIAVNNYQVNESYFTLVTKILQFLEEQFFRKQMLSQYKATQDLKVSNFKKLKNLRKNQIYETFLESINLPQLINVASNFEGENIIPLCCYFHYLHQLGTKKNKDIRFQQLFQQVSKFDYNFKCQILKFSQDNNYGIPFEFLAVYCSYKINELQLMDDQEFKNTYLATEKQKQELNQIFEYIVKFARNFIAYQQNEKLPKNIIIYIKEVYQRNEVLQFSQWKYENTKLNYSLPFLTEFSYRIDEFNKYLEDDKKNYSRNLEDLFTVNMEGEPVIKQSRLIIIKRGEEFQDAYDQLFNQQLKNLYHIKFFNQYGMLEDGIDGGGLTKEFLIRFVNQAFDPNFGLFVETPERTIIPNPAFMQQDLSKYEFVGKMIGKAIYEGILIEKVLCSIFLNQVLNVSNTIHDFRYFDQAQYQRIFNLKNQDVTDFGLTFSITENFYDQIVEFDLIKNGRNISVTNQNKLQYIKLYSDFRLNQQIKKQSQYFKKGLEEVIDSEKLKLFTNQELQLLISGQPVIDLVDLISNTYYKGYTPLDQTIKDFWDVLNEMEYSQQTQFLFFFTSCSRAPTQGFKSLDPPFQIQKIPINNQQDLQKLPTSSTCFNILKLPDYKNKALLKQKLIKAITSNSGLELT